MSYLALARKWRPFQFNQVVGQAHVLTALENALRQNKLHHAYLFSGTRGVGKTSIGRLFAKGLNCETGITATPCGVCATCKEIDEGRFIDLLEIDAASRTKVEDTRDLLDNVQYKPARGRFKVYLIDEVHMLSRHSFNALLKTLEEPPEYVKFLLATTDPQKLPVTILSRCLQFHLKPIDADVIHQQLDYILQQEQVVTEPRALGLIAHAADGSMRDALSLADQAIALGNGTVTKEVVSAMLGTLDADQAIHLLEAICSQKSQQVMTVLQAMAENGVEWDALLQALANQLHRIAMYQALPSTLDKSKPDAEKISQLSQHLAPQDVQLFYQIILKGREELPLAPAPRIGLEMTVLRLMAFRPEQSHTASEISYTDRDVPLPTVPLAREEAASDAANPDMAPQAPDTALASEPATMQDNERLLSNTVDTESTGALVNSEGFSEGVDAVQLDYPEPVDNSLAQEYAAQAYQTEAPFSPYEQLHQPLSEPDATPPAAESQPAVDSEGTSHSTEQAQTAVQHQAATGTSPLVGLRHQLRSKRERLSPSPADHDVKKGEAVLPSNVLDRVAQQHRAEQVVPQQQTEHSSQPHVVSTLPEGTGVSGALQPIDSAPTVVAEAEPYQWKATSVPTISDEDDVAVRPTQLKQALEHTKTPEMVAQLLNEATQCDQWSAMIQQLEVAKLVEQLALNAAFSKQGNNITLSLRASHAHLNTERSQAELLAGINRCLNETCQLSITIGDEGQTPMELREALYQEKLAVSRQVIHNDSHVQFIQTRFSATLDEESIRPI